MKKIVMVLIIISLNFNCNSKPSEGKAKETLQNYLNDVGYHFYVVESIEKTNGILSENNYKMEVNVKFKNTDTKLAGNMPRYSNPFGDSFAKYYLDCPNSAFKMETFDCKGKIPFVKTENGWMMER
jgi:hypothetical protein